MTVRGGDKGKAKTPKGAKTHLAVIQGGREDAATHPVTQAERVGSKPKPGLLRGQGHGAQGLTAKQEAYAQEVAKGSTLSAAYRKAYDAAGMSQSAIWREASLLMDNPKVAGRVDELIEVKEREALHDAARTRRFVLEELHKRCIDPALPPPVALRALELLGRSAALFIDKVESEVTTADTSSDALERALEERLARLFRDAS